MGSQNTKMNTAKTLYAHVPYLLYPVDSLSRTFLHLRCILTKIALDPSPCIQSSTFTNRSWQDGRLPSSAFRTGRLCFLRPTRPGRAYPNGTLNHRGPWTSNGSPPLSPVPRSSARQISAQ